MFLSAYSSEVGTGSLTKNMRHTATGAAVRIGTGRGNTRSRNSGRQLATTWA